MGEKSFLMKTLSLLVLSLFIPTILSRSSSTSTTSTVLDVSESLKRTLDVLDPERIVEKTLREQEPPQPQPQTLSLYLHPRSSLIKPHHKDYNSLTVSRLNRDSARVNSLITKLNFAIDGFNKSELKPVQTVYEPEDISTPVISGIEHGSGEYFARIGVGEPAKPFYMVIDTGSDINWLQCKPCSDCYQQADPIYDPAGSSSYTSLPCNSQQCSSLDVSACRSNTCLYQVSYGDGSYTVGDFITETVSFGSSGSVRNVAIGCGHDNEGLFVGAAGLIGLGGGALSLTSQIKATSFSYCLVDRDSTVSSTLEFNSATPPNSVTAPLLRNSRIDTFKYVGLTGISVGGHMLSIPQSVFVVDDSGRGGIIVDSGTAVTRLQSQAYDVLRDTFVQLARNLKSTSGFSLFDTCFDLSSMKSVNVPTVAFHFGAGKALPLPAKNYLIPIDSNGKYCLAFAPTQGSLSIIGNVQQQGTRVSYDLANSLVAFSPKNC